MGEEIIEAEVEGLACFVLDHQKTAQVAPQLALWNRALEEDAPAVQPTFLDELPEQPRASRQCHHVRRDVVERLPLHTLVERPVFFHRFTQYLQDAIGARRIENDSLYLPAVQF